MVLGQKHNSVKGKMKKVKQVPTANTEVYFDAPLQYNIPKGVEDSKRIKPKDVFEGFKDTKKSKSKSKSKNK